MVVFFKNYVKYLLPLFVWVGVQCIVAIQYGIGEGVDTVYYLELANNKISNFDLLEGRDWFYSLYALLLIFSQFVSAGNYQAVVVLQLLLSLWALICMARLPDLIRPSQYGGMISALSYAIWIKIHQWNFFIYTESIFTSISVISMYLILLPNKKWRICGLIGFWGLCFIRPTGYLQLGAVLLYLFINILRVMEFKKYKMLLLVFLIGWLIVLDRMLDHYDLICSYQKAEVIYPNISLGVKLPHDLVIPNHSSNLLNVLAFAWNNPVYFIKLAGFKLVLFLSNIKPYFSIYHNVIVFLCVSVLYYRAVKAMFVFCSDLRVWLWFGVFALQALVVSLTTENWDGRFFVPVLPFLMLLSSLVSVGKGENERVP